jgi:molybdopterin/thiamine biosynthesis adenylyltransferase
MKETNIKIIGLGGIGSWLVQFIAKYARFTMLQNKKIIITCIDGDSYDSLNRPRQHFKNLGSKARITMLELKEEYDRYIPPGFTLENFTFDSIDEYVSEDNVKSMISDGDTIFMGVDNHKTRSIVSKHCEKLENIILISGGNDITVGNIQIYQRKDGEEITSDLCAYHPEIENPRDKAPYELSCEELQESAPQLIFTNIMVAVLMCCAYYNLLTGTININNQIGEAYFDILTMKCDSKLRKPKKEKKEIN